MAEKARIGSDAKVLDLGCGNGTTAIWLSGDRDCHVTGVDLSGVRVENAQDALAGLDQAAQEKLAFEKASATELPFEDGTFTHLWSQAVIYHVPDKEMALKEAYRVLQDGGIMVFDDLVSTFQINSRRRPAPIPGACGSRYRGWFRGSSGPVRS